MKSPNTIANARTLLKTHVRPEIGALWVDRTWGYLNQACQHAEQGRGIKTNPAKNVLLPQVRAAKQRKAMTIDQVRRIERLRSIAMK